MTTMKTSLEMSFSEFLLILKNRSGEHSARIEGNVSYFCHYFCLDVLKNYAFVTCPVIFKQQKRRDDVGILNLRDI